MRRRSHVLGALLLTGAAAILVMACLDLVTEVLPTGLAAGVELLASGPFISPLGVVELLAAFPFAG